MFVCSLHVSGLCTAKREPYISTGPEGSGKKVILLVNKESLSIKEMLAHYT